MTGLLLNNFSTGTFCLENLPFCFSSAEKCFTKCKMGDNTKLSFFKTSAWYFSSNACRLYHLRSRRNVLLIGTSSQPCRIVFENKTFLSAENFTAFYFSDGLSGPGDLVLPGLWEAGSPRESCPPGGLSHGGLPWPGLNPLRKLPTRRIRRRSPDILPGYAQCRIKQPQTASPGGGVEGGR
jgi:hypothetical protein